MPETSRGQTRREAGQYMTPGEYATQLGVSVKKVTGWIKTGQLKAIDISEGRKKSQWLIHADAVEDFELRRSNVNVVPSGKKRKAAVSSSVPRKF